MKASKNSKIIFIDYSYYANNGKVWVYYPINSQWSTNCLSSHQII